MHWSVPETLFPQSEHQLQVLVTYFEDFEDFSHYEWATYGKPTESYNRLQALAVLNS
jgi:hypothetical protein